MTEARSFDGILAGMKERYRELAGCDSDEASDIGIRLRVLAKELAALEERLISLREQVFPQTSTGVYLDRHAAARGLVRKGARASEGRLRFSRETATGAALVIPAGAVAGTRFAPQLRFITTEACVIPPDKLSAEAPAMAELAGASGNAAAGAVTLLIGRPGGVTAVTNPAPFAGGLDGESDEALRARLLEAFRNISNGANAAYYHDIAMREPGVLSANVIPRARGRGTVDVVIRCEGSVAAEDMAARLAESFSRAREINVDVAVRAAVIRPVDIEIALACLDGFDSAAVAEECARRVRGHVGGLRVGEALYRAVLYRLLLGVDGVQNARIATPESDILPDPSTALGMGGLELTGMAVTA